MIDNRMHTLRYVNSDERRLYHRSAENFCSDYHSYSRSFHSNNLLPKRYIDRSRSRSKENYSRKYSSHDIRRRSPEESYDRSRLGSRNRSGDDLSNRSRESSNRSSREKSVRTWYETSPKSTSDYADERFDQNVSGISYKSFASSKWDTELSGSKYKKGERKSKNNAYILMDQRENDMKIDTSRVIKKSLLGDAPFTGERKKSLLGDAPPGYIGCLDYPDNHNKDHNNRSRDSSHLQKKNIPRENEFFNHSRDDYNIGQQEPNLVEVETSRHNVEITVEHNDHEDKQFDDPYKELGKKFAVTDYNHQAVDINKLEVVSPYPKKSLPETSYHGFETELDFNYKDTHQNMYTHTLANSLIDNSVETSIYTDDSYSELSRVDSSNHRIDNFGNTNHLNNQIKSLADLITTKSFEHNLPSDSINPIPNWNLIKLDPPLRTLMSENDISRCNIHDPRIQHLI